MKNNQYYIVRADRAGVFFGQIAAKNGDEVTMNQCRKIHYWDGAVAVEQLAVDGTSKPENCRLTVTVDNATIMQVIQIIPCTDKAVESLKGVKEWKR